MSTAPQNAEGVGQTAGYPKTLLFLTGSAVFLEIAACVWAIMHFGLGQSWAIPLLLACYHAGYLAVGILPTVVLRPGIFGFAACLVMLGIAWKLWVLAAIGLFLASTSLHTIRFLLKRTSRVGQREKSIAKLLGMLAASIAAGPSWLVLLAVALLALFVEALAWRVDRPAFPGNPGVQKDKRQFYLHAFEFLHHAHYFAYCYTFWLILKPALWPWTAALFPLGWVGYWIIERLMRTSANRNLLWLAIGHLVCAACLILMVSWQSSTGVLALWVLTGLGGGTAYMLDSIFRSPNREAYENAGHIAGCLGAALVIFLWQDVRASLVLGAALAVLASAVAVLPHAASVKGATQ